MRSIRCLSALRDALERAALHACSSASKVCVSTARSFAPVQSGALRRSIEAADTPGGAAVRASAPHAAPVEYGTSHTPPRPFMSGAARLAASYLAREAAREFKETAREVWR